MGALYQTYAKKTGQETAATKSTLKLMNHEASFPESHLTIKFINNLTQIHKSNTKLSNSPINKDQYVIITGDKCQVLGGQRVHVYMADCIGMLRDGSTALM